MIAVDTNLLVYAHRADSPFHERAVAVLVAKAESGDRWAIPWPCVHEFVAIVTHPRIYRPPTPLPMAFAALRAWLASPGVVLLAEGPTHLATLEALALGGHVAGAAIHDARIAALCKQHGVQALWSADRDFSRYGGLKVVNPLVG